MTASLEHRLPMEEVAAGRQTKSDKIRALSKAGYSRNEIANFLGVRYQFVRNVQVNDERAGKAAPSIQPFAQVAGADPSIARAGPEIMPIRVFVDARGEVSVPAHLVAALGLNVSDPIVLAVEGDEIRVMPIAAAVRRAQAIVRRYIPQGVNLSEELIADRRAEARREEQGD